MRTLPHALALALSAALPAGCTFDGGAAVGDSGTPPTSDVDESDCAVELPFAPKNIGDPCALPKPGPALVLDGGSYEIDTGADADWLTQADGTPIDVVATIVPQEGGPELLVIVAESLQLSATSSLRAVGERPLVFVTTGDMTIAGAIDVSATLEDLGGSTGPVTAPGPGGHHGCEGGRGQDGIQQRPTITPTPGGGGGGGGGFGTAGGPGARVDESELPPEEGRAPGGAAIDSNGLVPLRGGCPGGMGGWDGADYQGMAGAGGGAVGLIGGGTVSIAPIGTIDAGGSGGGRAVSTRRGGGGGGSGGAILIQAATISVNGTLAANGGGGGEGIQQTPPAVSGANGMVEATPAAGGASEGLGGDGGAGAVGTQDGAPGLEGETTTNGYPAGGGGGGGGVGVIVLHATESLDVSGTVSPPALAEGD